MKKLVFLLMCVFTMQVALADNDKPVTFEQLPQTAQQFVKKYFPEARVAFAKLDKEWFDSTYDVMFVNGNKVEFDSKGNWKKLKCKAGFVPEAVVPAPILKFVSSNYPDAKVVQIEKDRYEYEVTLSNFWEIKFDLDFNVIDMDHDD